MNSVALIVVVVLMALQAQADEKTIYLSNSNFNEIVKSNNFFVVFVKDRSIPEFDSFYEKVAQLYNSDEKSHIKMGKVMCKFNPEVCQDQKVGDELITVKFFGVEGGHFDYEPMANFFSSTIASHVKNFLLEDATAVKIRSGRNFVKFTVPYCGYCKKMAPTWIELEKAYKDDQEVSILSVDCKKQKDICNDFDVSGYPSIIWIEGGKRIDKYAGRRTVPDFSKYIKKMQMRSAQAVVTAAVDQPVKHESAVLDLTTADFKEAISSGFSFVYYSLPACSHCKEIEKVWNDLAKELKFSDDIKIARVDCQVNTQLCYNEAKGCPTLNIYNNGEVVLKDYYEDVTLDGLIDAITSHAKGGKDLGDWEIRNQEKRRVRRQQKKRDKKT